MISGCSYKVPSSVSPAVNIYSPYSEKIPGGVILVIDRNIREINRDIKPSSYICTLHSFPVRIDSALADSIRKTTEAVFERVIPQGNMPSKEQMMSLNAQGTVFVTLNRFEPKIRFTHGFWEPSAASSCDVVLDVRVRDRDNNNLLVTAVGGSRATDGGGGMYCGNGSEVLAEAVSLSVREAMERYAERISGSPKIRESFAMNK
jgi:hypothetical protein